MIQKDFFNNGFYPKQAKYNQPNPLWLALIVMLFCSPTAASVIGEPQCVAQLALKDIRADKRTTFIVEQVFPPQCTLISPGSVYALSAPKTLNAQTTRIYAGVVAGSSMGVDGPVLWLHWAPIVDANGYPILDEKNQRWIFSQSEPEPIR